MAVDCGDERVRGAGGAHRIKKPLIWARAAVTGARLNGPLGRTVPLCAKRSGVGAEAEGAAATSGIHGSQG